MKKLFHKALAKLLRFNLNSTPTNVILDQMSERRPLPMGIEEFEDWSNRIISGTLLPADNDSMKFALATMLLHLGPQEDHREDAYFIHTLRKSAINQIAHAKMKELKDAAQKKIDEDKSKAADASQKASEQAVEETKKRMKKAVPPKEGTVSEILANKEV